MIRRRLGMMQRWLSFKKICFGLMILGLGSCLACSISKPEIPPIETLSTKTKGTLSPQIVPAVPETGEPELARLIPTDDPTYDRDQKILGLKKEIQNLNDHLKKAKTNSNDLDRSFRLGLGELQSAMHEVVGANRKMRELSAHLEDNQHKGVLKDLGALKEQVSASEVAKKDALARYENVEKGILKQLHAMKLRRMEIGNLEAQLVYCETLREIYEDDGLGLR